MQKVIFSKKRIISVILAFAMTFSLVLSGCNKDNKQTTSTTAPTETTTQGPRQLATPGNVTITKNENANMAIQWNSVENAASYAIYRSQKAESDKAFNGYKLIGKTTDTTFTDTDSNVTANINWYYKVQALASEDANQSFTDSDLSQVVTTEITAETLKDRGVIGIDLAGNKGAETYVTAKAPNGKEYTSGVYLSWRAFEEDPDNVTFDVYRNGSLIADDIAVTNCIDESGKYGDVYKVIGTSDATLGIEAFEVSVWQNYYQEFVLNRPDTLNLPRKGSCEYYSNDLCVAELDGDGQYELIVKWMPDNSQDNSPGVITGYTYIDAYDINYMTGEATQLWRINLGPNIRSGAHYTQYLVWDMDGDGISEFACKTADGSTTYKCVNGELIETSYIGACNADAIPSDMVGRNPNDYRDSSGMILAGPEYLTIFRGDTGEVIDTVEYEPGRGNVTEWGDSYGNRSDRFLACVAYLDGEKPSMVFTRGYYAKTALTAYQLIDGKLTIQWKYNSEEILDALFEEFEANYTEEIATEYQKKYSLDFEGKDADDIKDMVLLQYKLETRPLYMGQGNHNLSVGDVDSDGKDEIVFGSMVFDNDGTVLYSTGFGHGDAIHLGDFCESNPGLEVFQVHEDASAKYIVDLRDAETGVTLYGKWVGKDNGRGMAADIDPRYIGAEVWSAADGNVHSSESTIENDIIVSENRPSINFDILWDGDLLNELQDHYFISDGYYPVSTIITDWDYENGTAVEVFNSTEILTINGSKGNVGLVADILGDWREEIVARASGNHAAIRIYMSVLPTEYVIPCLMQDEQYRLSIAWQNTSYNQPPHLSYMLTEGVRVAELTTEISSGKVVINYTAANDGIHGHEIEGYEIYRSEGDAPYTKLTTVGADILTFTDNSVTAGKKYLYKVAAIVDGQTSHFSFVTEVTAK